jgi:diguanylate cyclase (GGDEF)-like protein
MSLLQRLRPKRIGRRLALGFGALVALMLVALWYATAPIAVALKATEQFATGDMQRLLRVQALSLQTEGVGSALVRLLNAPRANRVAEYTDVDERNRRIDGIIESLVNDLHDPQQEETLQRLKDSRAIYADAFLATVDQVEAGDLQAASKALNERVNPSLKAMLTESNTLLQRERERIESQLDKAQITFHRIGNLAALSSLVAILAAAILAWRTTKSVVTPLATLESAARTIAQGDYQTKVHSTGTQEVDRVGAALNTMAEAVSLREQQIVRLAYEDALTGLPNRTALLNPLNPVGDAPASNTLVLIDLARLKTVNETLGYSTGDTLIKVLADRVTEVFQTAANDGLIGPAPVVARLSGGTLVGHFNAADRIAVETLYARLEVASSQSVQCGGHNVDVGFTCGFADSGDGAGAGAGNVAVNTLLRNAEVAMHTAKRSATAHAWHSEVQEAARLSHLNLVSDLRQAVAASQLQMWLQPKFSLVTGKAVGAEALVRWQHPTRGFVSPAEFVPFAEQTGYITLVTDWMLREALRTLQAWESKHPHLSISVNVSTRDLQDAGFAQRVHSLLTMHNVAPERLRLEITESGLMDDPQRSVALLEALRGIGVGLSIDDFGTGYSSLAYLQKLPVSELKIDRSFVENIDALPGTKKLVYTMIEMGHGMDLLVTAEGIETQAERDVLAGLGCDVMQGYFGSRPLHGSTLDAWFGALG